MSTQTSYAHRFVPMTLPRILLHDGQYRPRFYNDIRRSFDATWIEGASPCEVENATQLFDLAIVSDEYNDYQSSVVCKLVQQNVPTLLVMDGILEWRNTWENPRSLSQQNGMPLCQPVLSHKVACLGKSQARILESWGNLEKCEIIGAPWLDDLLNRKPRERNRGEQFTILIATASTPGFTEEHVAAVKRALLDIKSWFEESTRRDSIQVQWRITGGLQDELMIPEDQQSTLPLGDVLQRIDAVITTPSTLLVEAMLQGVPVALLDYLHRPQYVPAAWTISSREHIPEVVSDLMQPPPARMLYQNTVLHDALECRSPATQRMIELMDSMIRIGRECRARHEPLRLPPRIVQNEMPHHEPGESFDLAKLYPHHPVFSQWDRVALQTELGHLRLAMQQQQHELDRAKQELDKQSTLDRWLTRFAIGPLQAARSRVLQSRQRDQKD